MPSNHALLGPSSSKRWLSCTPSARLTENYEDKESVFAKEGTLAHSFAEYKLNKAIGKAITEPEKNEFYSTEIEECTNAYVSYIIELYEQAKKKCKDPILLVEQEVSLTEYVEGCFGTCDSLIASDDTLYIVDYKHGRGIPVNAENNTQMMMYALGALLIFDSLYDIKKIHMTIFQPRLSNISTFEMEKEELLDWAENILKPRALMAYKGVGEYHCGEWCTFCKARSTCRERAKSNMALAKDEFKEPPLLTDEEIEEVLSRIDGLLSWANDVKDYAFQEALNGKKWTNYKLVEGRSNRKYSNETEVANILIAAGYDPYEKKLVTITELQKRLGKQKFEELVGKFIVKPEGKPTLVERSDKRAEIEITSAQDDFKNIDKMED